MFLEVLSVVGPVLYWMGIVQGDRKLDGLSRWDGTLKSLVVPPHLLEYQQVVQPEAEQEITFDNNSSYTSYTPQSSVGSNPSQTHLYLYFGIFIAILVIISLLAEWIQNQMRSSTLKSASQTLTRQIRNSLQPLVKNLINNYQRTNAANKAYSDLTDLLYARIRLLERWVKDQEIEFQRGQKETPQSNLEERNQELDDLRAEKDQAESELRERRGELETLGTETETLRSTLVRKEDRIGQLESNSRQREQEIMTLKGEKEKLERDLGERDQRFATLEGEKERVEGELEGRNQRITTLEGEKEKLERDLGERDQRLTTLEGEKERVEGELEGRNQRITTLEGEKTSIEQNLRGKDQELVALGREKTTIQQKAETLEGTVKRFQEDLNAQNAVVSNLRAQLAPRNGSQKDGISTAPKPTSVAGEVAERNPVPARPPKPETKGTPMTHTLPPKPSFNNKTPVSSPASNPDSSPGADLLPSLLSGSRRPKGSAPPLLPHHQSFGATQNSSQGASSQPFPPFPPFRGFQPSTMPGYLPSTTSPAASSSPTPTPLSKNPPSSILTTSAIGAANGPSLFSNITGPNGPSGPRGSSIFGIFPPQSALFQNINPLPGLSTAPLPGTKPGYLFSTPGPAESSSPVPNPPPSILTTSTIDKTNGPSLFSNITAASGPSVPRGPRGPRNPSLFGIFPPQSPLFQNTNPLPGLSMPDSSEQSSATPLSKPAKEVVNPFAESFFDEKKAAAGDELASRAIRPMRKKRVVVSRPWPHARQNFEESTWHTDAWHSEDSVSWPHARQLNGKSNWR